MAEDVVVRSFMSEHTAEFTIVPKMAQILAGVAQCVVPLFFWRSREGNQLARNAFGEKSVRIVAVFARRPKVERCYETVAHVKFNREVLETASYLTAQGIAGFCGVPVVSSLSELQSFAPCLWFGLVPEGNASEDVTCTFRIPSGDLLTPLPQFIKGPLEAEGIQRLVAETCRGMSWPEAQEIIRVALVINAHSFFGQRYKPVYFVLTDGA